MGDFDCCADDLRGVRLDALRAAEATGEIIALTGPNSVATPGGEPTPGRSRRGRIHARIAGVLKEQDYGHCGAQPSRTGMAWAIVNEIWSDLMEIDALRAQIAILVRDHIDDPLEGGTGLFAALGQLVDRDPAIKAYLDRLTPGGDRP